jgi:nitrous oxidase accessory protein NosD
MYAIDLSGQVRNATIEDCIISNTNKGSGGAIMIRNSDPLPASATSHIILRGNRITSASDEPIAAFGWEGLVENIRIESNEVQADGASFGITAYGHNSPIQSGRINGVEIVGNSITGGNHGAIGVMGGAEDVSVIGNQVKATKADGIFLHQGGEGLPSVRKVKISRNSVQNTGRHGIFAAGADVIVEQNTINVCSGAGVYAIAGVLVIDNVISNAAPGILVDNGQQRDIRGNRLSNDNRILFVNSDGSTFTVRVEDNENPLSQ